MPTYEWLARFRADFTGLTPAQQATFLVAVSAFVEDMNRDEGFRNGLRIKGVQGAAGVFELTWAPDGRATFEYGTEVVAGEQHVVWRRVGTHAIFKRP